MFLDKLSIAAVFPTLRLYLCGLHQKEIFDQKISNFKNKEVSAEKKDLSWSENKSFRSQLSLRHKPEQMHTAAMTKIRWWDEMFWRAGGWVVRAHAIKAADPGSILAGGPLLHVTSPSRPCFLSVYC